MDAGGVGKCLFAGKMPAKGFGLRNTAEAGAQTFSLPRVLDEAVQTPARVNVTCVTPLGEDVASTS
jgi:hypothetical protein